MKIRLLTIEDFDQIERIYYDSFIAERHKRELRNLPVEKDFEKIAKKDKTWFDAIKALYLDPLDKHHLMWGAFDDTGNLTVYVCVRTDLPGIWRDGFVFAWMKGDPSVNNMTNGSLAAIWKEAYAHCEGIGLTKWYWIIEKDRLRKFNAFASRSTQFVDDRYDPYTLCDIPKGSKPDIDWVWSMIGRVTSPDTDYIVRAGRLKQHLIDSKS